MHNAESGDGDRMSRSSGVGAGGGGGVGWGGPSETTITGSVTLAAWSLLQSGYF